MNPLCTLRYSATHAARHHMVYRLDAVDAYERKLVKQIEVASATIEDAHNKPYVRLLSTSNRRGASAPRSSLTLSCMGECAAERRWFRMAMISNRQRAAPSIGTAVSARLGSRGENEFMELRVPGDERYLRPGEAWGDVDALAVARQMIRRTIREHLDKEKRLRPQGIKVLSLFFIDAVGRYRGYDENGNPAKGDYALIFEEEYRRLSKHPDYRTLFQEVDLTRAVEEVHNGYFSIDRKGGWTDTAENNQSNRDNAERAYT